MSLLSRGSQVAFAHPDGYAIMQALIERGVIGDFRAPMCCASVSRRCYLRYVDVWDAVAVLRDVMRTEAWRDAQVSAAAERDLEASSEQEHYSAPPAPSRKGSGSPAPLAILRLVLQRLGQSLRIDLDLHAGPLQLAQHDRP